jgi:hypothetical protein
MKKQKEMDGNTGAVPKSNSRSREIAKSKMQAWLDQLFCVLPRLISTAETMRLLQELGLLSDRQTFESNPILNDQQIVWRSRSHVHPPMYIPDHIRHSVESALNSPRPSKFDIFARPLILFAFSDRRPENKLHPFRREITIFPHRFELFEPHLRRRLLEWRVDFHGKISFVPDSGHYATVHKDIPARIVDLCQSLRISAQYAHADSAIVERI